MGLLLKSQGILDEAEELYREALEKSQRMLGDDHPNTFNSIDKRMGDLLRNQSMLGEKAVDTG